MPALEIITFGCRLNAYESEVIRRAADKAGPGDTVIVNTCAVTAEAERQARQAIRRARREHPAARIIVTGCAATLAPQLYAAMPGSTRFSTMIRSCGQKVTQTLTLPSPRDGSLPLRQAGEGFFRWRP